MRVIFVAPFFLETTLRFVNATADLPGVQLGLLSQDPYEKLPITLQKKIAAHWRVDHALGTEHLLHGVDGLRRKLGGCDRLLGPLEHIQVQVAEVRDHFGIPGMSAETIKNFRDKARMKDRFRAAGIPCARHTLVQSDTDAWNFVRTVGYPVVLKPKEGSASQGTARVQNDAEMTHHLGWMRPSPHNPVVAEEFVTGLERSFETISIRGVPVWDSHTSYDPAPLSVLENPWIQWTVLLPKEVETTDTQAIRKDARAALTALGMGTGLSHMEWFRRPNGSIAISEVAARPPGAQIVTLNSYAHDVDFYRLWSNLMVFEQFSPPTRKFAAGAAFFRGQGRGNVIAVHGLDQAQREIGHLVVEARLPKPGMPQGATYEGEGYAIVRHPDTLVVEHALQRLISLVRVELGG